MIGEDSKHKFNLKLTVYSFPYCSAQEGNLFTSMLRIPPAEIIHMMFSPAATKFIQIPVLSIFLYHQIYDFRNNTRNRERVESEKIKESNMYVLKISRSFTAPELNTRAFGGEATGKLRTNL